MPWNNIPNCANCGKRLDRKDQRRYVKEASTWKYIPELEVLVNKTFTIDDVICKKYHSIVVITIPRFRNSIIQERIAANIHEPLPTLRSLQSLEYRVNRVSYEDQSQSQDSNYTAEAHVPQIHQGEACEVAGVSFRQASLNEISENNLEDNLRLSLTEEVITSEATLNNPNDQDFNDYQRNTIIEQSHSIELQNCGNASTTTRTLELSRAVGASMPECSSSDSSQNSSSSNTNMAAQNCNSSHCAMMRDDSDSNLSQTNEPNNAYGENILSNSENNNTMLSQISVQTGSQDFSDRTIIPPIRNRRAPQKTFLPVKAATTTQSKCFLCNSTAGRKRVSKQVILQVWRKTKILVVPGTRVCGIHLQNGFLNEEGLSMVKSSKEGAHLSFPQVVQFLDGLTDLAEHAINCRLHFSEMSSLTDDDYHMLLGLSRANFGVLVNICSNDAQMRNSKNRTVRNAVAVWFLKLRLNLSQKVIGWIFGLQNPQTSVSKIMEHVTEALYVYFVPNYIGFQHKSRQFYLEKHTTEYARTLFNLEPDELIFVADATYLFVQTPSDFEMQQKTWCIHKMKNLVKIMIIAAPTGYVYSATGPWYCDHNNNDANILNNMLETDLPNSFSSLFRPNDCGLVGRGFRDVVTDLEALGINVFMPSLLDRKDKQLSVMAANKSRLAAMLRWVVEAVNGRLKNMYKFLDQRQIPVPYIKNLGRYTEIILATMNAFSSSLFSDTDENLALVKKATLRVDQCNLLKDRVENEFLHTNYNIVWEKAFASSLTDFPVPTYDDLKDITLGVYQIRLADRYTTLHSKNGEYEIYIHSEGEGIVRIKMESRFRRRKTHLLWIEYVPNGFGSNDIKGWYCRCQCGARRLGCCAHIASVISYFGITARNPELAKRHCSVSDRMLDAASAFASDSNLNSIESDDESGTD